MMTTPRIVIYLMLWSTHDNHLTVIMDIYLKC